MQLDEFLNECKRGLSLVNNVLILHTSQNTREHEQTHMKTIQNSLCCTKQQQGKGREVKTTEGRPKGSAASHTKEISYTFLLEFSLCSDWCRILCRSDLCIGEARPI